MLVPISRLRTVDRKKERKERERESERAREQERESESERASERERERVLFMLFEYKRLFPSLKRMTVVPCSFRFSVRGISHARRICQCCLKR